MHKLTSFVFYSCCYTLLFQNGWRFRRFRRRKWRRWLLLRFCALYNHFLLFLPCTWIWRCVLFVFYFLKYNITIFFTFSLRHGCCHGCCHWKKLDRHFFVFGGGLWCFGSIFCSLCIPTSYFFSWSIHCATPEEEKTRRLRQRRTASQQRRLAERINF